MFGCQLGFRWVAVLAAVVLLSGVGRATAWAKDSEAEAAYEAAAGLFNLGLWEQAAKAYKEYFKKYPRHSLAGHAHFGLGLCHFNMKEYAGAATQLKAAAASKGPDKVEANLYLGQALLMKASAEPGNAEDAFEVALKTLGFSKQGIIQRTWNGKSVKEWVEKKENEKPKRRELASDVFVGLLEATYLQGEWASVVRKTEAFDPLLQGSPVEQRVRVLTGEAHAKSKDYKKAAEAYEAAAKLKGTDAPEALFRLGLIRLNHLKLFEAAAKDFHTFAKQYKKDAKQPDAAFNEAYCYLQSFQWDEKGPHLARAKELFGNFGRTNPKHKMAETARYYVEQLNKITGKKKHATFFRTTVLNVTPDSFSPSVSRPPIVKSGASRAETSQAMAAASQSVAQSASAKSANSPNSVAPVGPSVSVSGSRAAGSGVRSNDARAESSLAMSAASSQSLAQASPAIGISGRVTSSARSYKSPASVTGSGESGSFSALTSDSRVMSLAKMKLMGFAHLEDRIFKAGIKTVKWTGYDVKEKFGKPVKVPSGYSSHEKYDSKGSLVEEINRYEAVVWENKTTFKYDENGNIIQKEELDGQSEKIKSMQTIKYDERGNKIDVIEYDSEGNLTSKTKTKYDGVRGAADEVRYYSNGKIEYTRTFKYDEKGNRIEEVKHNSNKKIEYTRAFKYDENGNQVESTEVHNELLEGKINPINISRYYKRDEEGNITEYEIQYHSGKEKIAEKWTYENDKRGNVTRVVLAKLDTRFGEERFVPYSEFVAELTYWD